MSDKARIIVTVNCTWDGDGTSTKDEDIQAYNDAMQDVVDYCCDVESHVDGVSLRDVEATG